MTRRSILIVFSLLLWAPVSPGSASASAVSQLPNLNLLTPYATFGNFFNDSNVTVQGNAAISGGGIFKLESPSHVTGNLYLGTGATPSGGGYSGNVQGTIYTGLNFTAAQQQVFDASSALMSLPANSTLASITTGMTFGAINGIADIYVINVTSNISLGSGEIISFVGDPGDYFVLNVADDVDMSGDAAIGTVGQASHVLFNLRTTGSLGNVAHIDNVINATTLIPYATYAEFHSVNGAIYGGFGSDGAGGNGEIKLMSGAQVQAVPFQAVPEPSTVLLLTLGLFTAWAGRGRRIPFE